MTLEPANGRPAGLLAAIVLGGFGLLALTAPGGVALLAPVAIGVAVAMRPVLTTPLIAVTLPFHLHPIGVSSFALSATEITIGGSVLGMALRASLDRILHRRPGLTIVASSADWIAAAFLAAGLLSLLPSEYLKQSLRELRWLILEPILVFYAVRLTIQTDRAVFATLWAVVLAGVVASVAALADPLTSKTFLDLNTRPAGPYPSPNHLALFLERTAAVGLALALFTRESRWAGGATSFVSLIVLRTLSLGAWLGLGASSLVLFALRGRRWAIGAAGGLVIATALALMVLPPERTLDRLSPEHGTALFRIEIWTAAVHMLADHPVLGVGLDNFLYQYRSRYMLPEAWEEPNISHPHNWVLDFWLSLGLPGLAAGVTAVIWIGRAAHRRFRHPASASDAALGAASLGVLLAFLIHGSLDNSYFLVDLAIVWWILIGLLARPRSGAA